MRPRPEYIEPMYCCDEEMHFSGVQVNLARFFCPKCVYRRDYRVSTEVQARYDAEQVTA